MDLKYIQARDTYSDIYQHIETLKQYAKKCNSVAEFGVRSCVSTWAFVKALSENKNKKLIGVDLNHHPNIREVFEICKANQIEYKFIQSNSNKVDLEEVDLLFIDTWHVYAHLKEELKHHFKVRKYIILHDTTVDAEWGETIREKMNAEQQAKQTGYKLEDIKKGLWPAIVEFLQENKEWKLIKRYHHNNGLTILGKSAIIKNDSIIQIGDTESKNWWFNHYKDWEMETFYIFDQYLDSSKNFLDIGAWIGSTCLYAGKKSNKVVAVEADPKAIQDLKINIQENDLSNITICEKAIVGKESGGLYFGPKGENEDWNLSTSMLKLKSNNKNDIKIKGITLPEIKQEYKIDNLSLVKVDIEGGEENIIPELFTLFPDIPIYLSFHVSWWQNQNVKRFEEYFSKYKYVYYQLDQIKLDELYSILQKDPFGSILFTNYLNFSSPIQKVDFPIYVIAYNNLTFVKNTVNQLEKYANIIIVDNNSDYPPLLRYYKDKNLKVWQLNDNIGAEKFVLKYFNQLPDIFALTDPDLQYQDLPSNWLFVLANLTKTLGCWKAGCALEISDTEKFKPLKFANHTIYQWESQFWSDIFKPILEMEKEGLEIYRSNIDSTMAVYNKANFTNHFLGPAIRVAGHFTVRHLPWYKDELDLTEEEKQYYYKKNNISCWKSST